MCIRDRAWTQYWDDVSGKALKKELVEEARAEEMATVKRMKVWIKVDREECFRETGKPPIKLRWVDINKGDNEQPNYRSRILAKEIRTDSRPDLFAATPLVEHIKYLISRVASSQHSPRPTYLMINDVKKAYFFADATRKIYIELPPEDYEAGKCGLLQKSLYGTRDAALNWTIAYTSALVDRMGFVQGKSTPCAFVNRELQVRTVVHGDDFVSEGPPAGLKKFEDMLKAEFEIKTEILGPEKRHVQELKILNRIVTWEKDGIMWEPDPRHAELIIAQLGLENAKPVSTPAMKQAEKGESEATALPDSIYPTFRRGAGVGPPRRAAQRVADAAVRPLRAVQRARRHSAQRKYGAAPALDGRPLGVRHRRRVRRGRRDCVRGASAQAVVQDVQRAERVSARHHR